MSTTYQIILLLHLISAVAAFGPLLAYPLIARAGVAAGAAGALTRSTTYLVLPGQIGLFVLGILLVTSSDGAIEFSETWISIAFLLSLAAIAIVAFLLLPLQRRIASFADRAGGESATEDLVKRSGMITGVLHLLLVLSLIVMVWQPGA